MDKRIILKRFKKENEFSYFAQLVFNEKVMKMNMGRIFTQDEAEEYFSSIIKYNLSNESSGSYMVFLKKDNTFIGICSLWANSDEAEVEYMMLPEYWGHGYGTEMAGCLIEKAKCLPYVKKALGLTDPKNVSSINVLIKNGFKFERCMEVEEDNSTIEIYSRMI